MSRKWRDGALVPDGEQAAAESHCDKPVDGIDTEELERLAFTDVLSKQRRNHEIPSPQTTPTNMPIGESRNAGEHDDLREGEGKDEIGDEHQGHYSARIALFLTFGCAHERSVGLVEDDSVPEPADQPLKHRRSKDGQHIGVIRSSCENPPRFIDFRRPWA